MTFSRGLIVHLVGAVIFAAVAQSALGLDYPVRPVRIIVGVAAGGANSTVARPIAQSLAERLGQQFFIENRPGAGGSVRAEAAVNAAPRWPTADTASGRRGAPPTKPSTSSIGTSTKASPI